MRRDCSGDEVATHQRELRALAEEQQFLLASEDMLVVDSDREFPLLMATLPLNEVNAILVPHLRHVIGWLDLMRSKFEVWTVHPLRCWAQKTASSESQSLSSEPGR
ncbi:hypothetical protein D7D52_17020 [Nocardia yunnanensis]|uniref:Uncharacterized protein n=1 Tax=Nocardia yunnanensis TaxID=2382165 RepID=A0A386ZCA4_9NOCA|nr:hypothetical protein D7D52_17020 [Nocardia yunnanensis]